MPGLLSNAMLNNLIREPVVSGSAEVVLAPLAALRGEGAAPAGTGTD